MDTRGADLKKPGGRTIERERKDLGFHTQTTKVAKESDKWRGLVKGPILLKESWK